MADARPRSLKLHMSLTVPPALVRANKGKERERGCQKTES
jgi:hypothetical protein